MRHGVSSLMVLALLASSGGCESEVPVPTSERRDSAGIEMVEPASPQWADRDGWRVDSIPRWKPSGSGLEYEFTRVTDATVLDDGQIVVLNEGTYQVRYYDAEGRFVSQMGREGEGPGDFSRLTNVSTFRGDSVLVFDFWLRRASILDGSATLGRVVTLPPELQVEELHPVTVDYLVAKTWSLEDFYEQEGPYRGQYLVLGVSARGQVLDSIAVLQGWNGFKVNREDGSYSDISPLIIMDGHIAANVHGIVMSPGDVPEIFRYSADGQLKHIIRVPSLSVPLQPGEIQAERDWLDRPQAPAWFRQAVRDMPIPDRKPAHGDLLLDSEGFVWAARYRSPRLEADEPVSWDIFDPSGAWLGTVTTPERFTVLEVGSDYVLGVRRDDLDVEQVQVFALDRRTEN